MSTDNPNAYQAMTEAVEGARDALGLYGFIVGVDTAKGGSTYVYVDLEDPVEGQSAEVESFDNVPDFEKWASDTITAHQEATA